MNSGHYGFPNILGLLLATAIKAIGKPGATAGSAVLAGGTASGAPTSGQFDAGDLVVDQGTPALWVCTTSGSPGTWAQAGQLSSPLVLVPTPWAFVDDSASDNGQPVDFVTTAAGDVISVGGM